MQKKQEFVTPLRIDQGRLPFLISFSFLTFAE